MVSTSSSSPTSATVRPSLMSKSTSNPPPSMALIPSQKINPHTDLSVFVSKITPMSSSFLFLLCHLPLPVQNRHSTTAHAHESPKYNEIAITAIDWRQKQLLTSQVLLWTRSCFKPQKSVLLSKKRKSESVISRGLKFHTGMDHGTCDSQYVSFQLRKHSCVRAAYPILSYSYECRSRWQTNPFDETQNSKFSGPCVFWKLSAS